MATLEATMALRDRFTSVLNSMNNSIKRTTKTMESLKNAGKSGGSSLQPMAQQTENITRQIMASQRKMLQERSRANNQMTASVKQSSSMQMSTIWQTAQSVAKSNSQMAMSAQTSAREQQSSAQAMQSSMKATATSASQGATQVESSMSRMAKNIGNRMKEMARSFNPKQMFSNFISGFKNVASSVGSGVRRIISLFGNMGNRIRQTFSGLRSATSGVFDRLRSGAESSRSSIGGLTGSVKNLVSSLLLVRGLGAVTNMIGQGMSNAIDRFDTLERFPRVMSSMEFDMSDVVSSRARLVEGIDRLPTTLNEAVSNTQGLAILTNDLGRATELTLALNNGFLASGSSTADVNRGMQQFSQMLGTGEVDIMSWRTLIETMPVALKEVSESLGYKDYYKLYDALKDGSLTFDEFADSIIKVNTESDKMYELARQNSRGIRTAMALNANAFTVGFANTFSKINESLKANGLPDIIDIIEGMRNPINNAFNKMNERIPMYVKKLVGAARIAKDAWDMIFGFDGGDITFIEKAQKFGKNMWEFLNPGQARLYTNYDVVDYWADVARKMSYAGLVAKGVYNTLFNRDDKSIPDIFKNWTNDEKHRNWFGVQQVQFGLEMLGIPKAQAQAVSDMIIGWGASIDTIRNINWGEVWGDIQAGFSSFSQTELGKQLASNMPKLAKFAGSILAISTGYKLLGKLALPLARIAMAHPLLALTTGLAGLGAGFFYAYENVDGFAEKFHGVWEKAKDTRTFKALDQAIREIGSTVGRINWSGMLENPSQIFSGLWDVLKSVAPNALNILGGIAGDLGSWATNIFRGINWGSVGSEAYSFVVTLGETIASWLPSLGSSAGALAGAIGNAAKDILSGFVRNINGMSPDETITTVDILNAVWTGTGDFVGWASKSLAGFGSAFLTALREEITGETSAEVKVRQEKERKDAITNAKNTPESERTLRQRQIVREVEWGDPQHNVNKMLPEQAYDPFSATRQNNDGSRTSNVSKGSVKEVSLSQQFAQNFNTGLHNLGQTLIADPLRRLWNLGTGEPDPVIRKKNASTSTQLGHGSYGRNINIIDAFKGMFNPQKAPVDDGKRGGGGRIGGQAEPPENTSGFFSNLGSSIKSLFTPTTVSAQATTPVISAPSRNNIVPAGASTATRAVSQPIQQPRKIETPQPKPILGSRGEFTNTIRKTLGNANNEVTRGTSTMVSNINAAGTTIREDSKTAFSGVANGARTGMSAMTGEVSSNSTASQGIFGMASAMMAGSSSSSMASILGSSTMGMLGMFATVGANSSASNAVFGEAGSMMVSNNAMTMMAILATSTIGMMGFNMTITAGMAMANATVSAGSATMVATVSGLYGSMFSAGVFAMSGLAAGINAGAGAAIAAARRVANSVASTIQGALRIASPSKLLRSIGRWAPIGLGMGILDGEKFVVDSTKKMIKPLTDLILPELELPSMGVQSQELTFAYDYSEELGTPMLNTLSQMVSYDYDLPTLELPSMGVQSIGLTYEPDYLEVSPKKLKEYQNNSNIVVEVENKQLAPQISIQIDNNGGDLDENEIIRRIEETLIELLDSDLN